MYDLNEIINKAHENAVKRNVYDCQECGGTSTRYWYGSCDCGWHGTADKAYGGGPIADTGDYDDVICPCCYKILEESECPVCNDSGKTPQKNIIAKLREEVSELEKAFTGNNNSRYLMSIRSMLYTSFDKDQKNKYIEVFEKYIKNTIGDELADIILVCLAAAKELNILIIKHLQLKNKYNEVRNDN